VEWEWYSLKDVRMKAGFTHQELGNYIGHSKRYCILVEQGMSYPTMPVALDICYTLKVNPFRISEWSSSERDASFVMSDDYKQADLRKARNRLGLSQEEVADKIQSSLRHYAYIELHKAHPTVIFGLDICALLQINPFKVVEWKTPLRTRRGPRPWTTRKNK